MAFANRNLAVLAYANGFTLWHYTTPDADTAVEGANYFDNAADALRVGDMLITNTDTATSPKSVILTVSANTEGEVTVTNIIPAQQGGL